MEEVNITIIGAGVVGLAIAAELSSNFDDILVLERHETFGRETSSRNSEVIHSGAYYPYGSLKANLCVEGAERLYYICDQFSIPYKQLGKLIIATDEAEIEVLEELLSKAQRNNVKEVHLLTKHDVQHLEPRVNAACALHFPYTGILDSHSLMKTLSNISKRRGVLFSYKSEVEFIRSESGWFIVGIKQENYEFKSKVVINCAGLFSDGIARLAGIDIEKNDYKIRYCKGTYFSYTKPSPVTKLIYPVPHDNLVGLGVHATPDLSNRLRFGPDAEYVPEINYSIASAKKNIFWREAIKLIPGIEEQALVPDMVGIRPKLSPHGGKVRDFVIKHENDNGLSGFINLIGIESPGLTASPAIARMVAGIVADIMN